MNDLEKVQRKLDALEKLVLVQQEAIKAIATALGSSMKVVGKLANITEETQVQQLKASLEASEKCGKHCGCGDH